MVRSIHARGMRAALFYCALLFASLPLVADDCEADAGTITMDFGPHCLLNGEATLVAAPADAVVPAGFTTLYVLTHTNGLVIEQVSVDPGFVVTEVGVWRIHALVYDPTTLDLSFIQFGSTSAYELQALLPQGGGEICGSLTISGAPCKTMECPCDADAGLITMDFGPHCLVNGEATLVAFPVDATVPPGFTTLYVLTHTNGLVIEQVSVDPSFVVTDPGVWRIHTLVYDPNTLDLSFIQFGSTSAYELQALILQGGGNICASFTISGAPCKTAICEEACTADAGTISANQPDLCLVDGEAALEATPDGNAVVPDGYSVLHLLTVVPDPLIIQTGTTPSFTVTSEGPYSILTLIYDPATFDPGTIVPGVANANDLNALFLQGGGSLCGSLDLVGAQFFVADCAPVCTAWAGTLTAEEPELCLVDGIATMIAIPNGDAVIPDGYTVAYLLTQLPDLIVQNVEPDPEFEWPLQGVYAIHTLVYDPFTLNPFDIPLGLTTLDEVNAVLIQGGGPICGSLDLIGAEFFIIDCAPVCDAFAGTLSAEETELCLIDGIATMVGIPNGDAVVPAGYSVAYLLTQDPGAIIQNVEPDPEFEWPLVGEYAIHTLVYDPNDLNPYDIPLGLTALAEVNALLIQGGGPICGSLDLAGAQFIISDCTPPCTAGVDADTTVCFTDAPFNLLELLGPNVCPDGIWAGLTTAGVFDPAVDPSGVYTYTAVLDNGLTDVATITVNVIECGDPCTANAGADGEATLCSTSSTQSLITYLGGTPVNGGSWIGPDGLPHSGVFAPGIDPPGSYTYIVSDVPPCPNDSATVTVEVIPAANAGTNGVLSLCSNSPEVDLTASLGGDPDPTGSWSSPAGEPFDGVFTPGVDDPGVYTYVVPGTGPCQSDSSIVTVVVVTAPNAGGSTSVTVCDDAPVISLFDLLGGTPQPGGTWSAPGGAPHSGIFDPGVDPPGAYSYAVNGVSPCQDAVAILSIAVEDCCDAGEDAEIEVCFTDPPFALFDLLGGEPCPGGIWMELNMDPHSGVFDPGSDPSGVFVYSVTNNGSTDLSTVVVNVIECPTTCEAVPGTLSTGSPELCLENGSALLVATPNGDSNVPAGYETVFLLSIGEDLVVIDVDAVPFFTVSGIGLYTIHTLVYDPATLDLGSMGFEIETVTELDALLIQGGGTICAGLDVAGAPILVVECSDDCAGAAGADTLVQVCNDGSMIALFPLLGGSPLPGGNWFWTSIGNINPEITSGLYDTMIGTGGVAGYTVSAGVDCPPDTAYIEIVEIDCTDPCGGGEPDAGIGGDMFICDTDPPVDLFSLLQGTPDAGGSWSDQNGDPFGGTFDPATDPAGVYLYTVSFGPDCPQDTTQLIMNVIPCGEVIGTDVELMVWPNPTADLVNVTIPTAVTIGARVQVIDAAGRVTTMPFTISTGLLTLDVRALPAGPYQLRLTQRGGVLTGRFVRARN